MKRSKKTAPIEQAGMCAFFEAVPEAALILDRDGAIIAANTTAARRMGLDDPLDLRGKNVLDSLPKEVAEHRREMIRQAVATGEAMRFEDEHDGRIESHVLSPILDEDGRVVSLAASITDITEFRRAGEELRREQQRQIFLMEFLPGFVFVLAQDHTIRYANRYFRRYFGSPKGKRCHEIFRKSSTPCASCAPANVFRSERPTQWEWTNADNRTFQIHSHPMTDVDGSLVAVILGMDITARKLAEDELRRAHDELEVRVEQRTSELRRSESRYRAVVEDQSELICRFGDDRRITFANRAFCRFFGRQDEEMSGRPFLPEVVDDDLPVLESLLESLSAQSPLKMDDFRVVAPSGETRWIRWTVRAVASESGGLTEYQAVGRD
ncbi:MAG: PAS domain-containing protein, partial [Desulfovibrionaceae bacterium]|nr:PAS domain-containing protein [Desulfovibrionaceae bacterium]